MSFLLLRNLKKINLFGPVYSRAGIEPPLRQIRSGNVLRFSDDNKDPPSKESQISKKANVSRPRADVENIIEKSFAKFEDEKDEQEITLNLRLQDEEENLAEELSFGKAFDKFESQIQQDKRREDEQRRAQERKSRQKPKSRTPIPFTTLLRKSPFIQMGDPIGRIVKGKIFHVVEDDLYVDFGSKMYCVVRRPDKNPELFVRGTIVRLRIVDLELTDRFLGTETDMTLNEADCQLMGLIWTPVKDKSGNNFLDSRSDQV